MLEIEENIGLSDDMAKAWQPALYMGLLAGQQQTSQTSPQWGFCFMGICFMGISWGYITNHLNMDNMGHFTIYFMLSRKNGDGSTKNLGFKEEKCPFPTAILEISWFNGDIMDV